MFVWSILHKPKPAIFLKEYCSLYAQLWTLRSHIKTIANWSGVIIMTIMSINKNMRQNFNTAPWAGVVQVNWTDLQSLKQQS